MTISKARASNFSKMENSIYTMEILVTIGEKSYQTFLGNLEQVHRKLLSRLKKNCGLEKLKVKWHNLKNR
jgi:hypothetical protein